MAKRYSENEDEVLFYLSDTHTPKEISNILGRSIESIYGRRCILGLSNSKTPSNKWTEDDDRILEILIRWSCSHQDIADYFGVKITTIHYRVEKAGLGKPTGANYILQHCGVKA